MCRKLLIKSQVISSYNIGILILQMIRVHKGSDPTLKNYCISPISHYLVLKVQKVSLLSSRATDITYWMKTNGPSVATGDRSIEWKLRK